MPSTYKTTNIGLNKFIATDKPKMDDFNFDNQKLDEALGEHIADNTKHLTATNVMELHNSMLTYGSYTGNGADTQHITLGFHARAGIVFAPNFIPFRGSPSEPGFAETTCAFFTRDANTRGIRITSSGITVYNNDNDSNSETTLLNFSDVQYHYIIWK